MEFKLSQVYFVFFCGFFSSERLQGHVREHWKGSHVSDRGLDGASLHPGPGRPLSAGGGLQNGSERHRDWKRNGPSLGGWGGIGRRPLRKILDNICDSLVSFISPQT